MTAPTAAQLAKARALWDDSISRQYVMPSAAVDSHTTRDHRIAQIAQALADAYESGVRDSADAVRYRKGEAICHLQDAILALLDPPPTGDDK